MTTPVFNLEKSLQAILYVASSLKRKDFHKIFKVLYFADRGHLSKYGRSITGDTYIKMEYGPVPSNIRDIFSAVRGDSFFAPYATEYKKLFTINGFFVCPNMDADLDYLSRSDIEEIDESLRIHGEMSMDDLTNKSHDFAWHSTLDNTPISVEDILREAGSEEEYIQYIKEQIALDKAVCDAFV